MKLTVEIFMENHWLCGISADRIDREFSILCENPSFIEKAKQFTANKTRIDNFWSNIGVQHGLQLDFTNFLKKVLGSLILLVYYYYNKV